MRYQEHMLDLQNRERMVEEHDQDGVIWDVDSERLATKASRNTTLPSPAPRTVRDSAEGPSPVGCWEGWGRRALGGI
jgi:hypothetical protein